MDDNIKQPEIRPGKSLYWSWVWLVPILALIIAISLLVSVWVRSGPVVTISFESVSGLDIGQTKLRYRDVVIGEVSDIRVADDRQQVLVSVQLKRQGSKYITQKNSKFWIVRPQVSVAGVSGLDTLFSGAYISVDAPMRLTNDDPVFEFVGLANPPEVLNGQTGTRFNLHTQSIKSLDVGSRVYYRRLEVGRVVAISMADDGRTVALQVFIEKPYDRFVTNDTRFWNDSGIDMSVSTDGVELNTSGLSALVSGGISFTQADEALEYDGEFDNKPAKPDTSFTLFDTKVLALAEPDKDPVEVELRFNQSVRGLKIGATVDFLGIKIGKVIDIDLEYDPDKKRFYTSIRAEIYPNRMSDAYYDRAQAISDKNTESAHMIFGPLIKHGLRAQLKTASLLTGQQYIALSFHGEKTADQIIEIGRLPGRAYLIPTIASDFDKIQDQIGNIVDKVDSMPLGEIGDEVLASLKSIRALTDNLNKNSAPKLDGALLALQNSLDKLNKLLNSDSPLLGSVQGTLQNIEQAARALRLLSDTISAQPETMLRGHAPDTIH